MLPSFPSLYCQEFRSYSKNLLPKMEGDFYALNISDQAPHSVHPIFDFAYALVVSLTVGGHNPSGFST